MATGILCGYIKALNHHTFLIKLDIHAYVHYNRKIWNLFVWNGGAGLVICLYAECECYANVWVFGIYIKQNSWMNMMWERV